MSWLDSLDDLADREKAARHTAFADDLSNVYVPGEGNLDNPLAMIIGEAPGAQEEIKQRPFVGPAGQVLRDLMAAAELFTGTTPHFGDANCWLTNVVKFRPPGNRTPTLGEIRVFRTYLHTEWTLIGKPSVIIPVGGTALYAVLGKKVSILKTAGRPHKVHSRRSKQDFYVWPMIHPAFGLRNKAVQPLMERDWGKLGEWLLTEMTSPIGVLHGDAPEWTLR